MNRILLALLILPMISLSSGCNQRKQEPPQQAVQGSAGGVAVGAGANVNIK